MSKIRGQAPKNRQGRVYPYFMCIGRHQKRNDCLQKAIPIDVAEMLVEDLYRDVQLTTEQRNVVEQQLLDDLRSHCEAAEDQRRDLDTQRERLLTERTQLLRAHYADAVPLDLLKSEQDRIARQLGYVRQSERDLFTNLSVTPNLDRGSVHEFERHSVRGWGCHACRLCRGLR